MHRPADSTIQALQKRRRNLAIALGALAFTMLGVFQNCGEARLSLVQEIASAQSKGEICAVVPTAFNAYTKILFVVDKSGSNVTGSGGVAATDPGAVFRTGVIRSFYDKHKANELVEWGLVVFQGSTSASYINDGGKSFTRDEPTFTAAVDQIATATDAGGTPYVAALTQAQTILSADKTANPGANISYIVVFLSDGVPNDTDANVFTAIDNLLVQGKVTLSTVYYGPANPGASARMQRMADAGGGKFLDTNVSGRIPIDDLIAFATAEPWIIKSFVVSNMNASPCDDGTVGSDSDADGLCDKDELRYNTEYKSDPSKWQRMGGKLFDPYNRNSFSTALSDVFYHRYILFSEAVPRDCIETTDDDGDLANGCEEKYFYSNTPVGPTQKWTDAMGNDGDPKNFDSDGDGYLDWFEFIMSRNKSGAMDANNITQLFLGVRLDTIYQQHRNVKNPASSSPYDGQLLYSHVNSTGQNCYSFKQTVLPLYRTGAVTLPQVGNNSNLVHGTNENVVMVYFIQTPENDPNGPGELRYSFQKVSEASASVNLNLRVDQYRSYKVGEDARVKP